MPWYSLCSISWYLFHVGVFLIFSTAVMLQIYSFIVSFNNGGGFWDATRIFHSFWSFGSFLPKKYRLIEKKYAHTNYYNDAGRLAAIGFAFGLLIMIAGLSMTELAC
jgi:hypothetical protein